MAVTAIHVHAHDDLDRPATAFSHDSAPIGDAALDRDIHVMVFSYGVSGPVTVADLTVGGVPLSFVARATNGVGAGTVELWKGRVPTGDTATIATNFSDDSWNCSMHVWAVYGALPTPPVTYGNNDVPESTEDPLTFPEMPVSAGAAVLAAVYGFGWPTGTSWTGLALDDEFVPDGNVQIYAGASTVLGSAEPALAVVVDWLNGEFQGQAQERVGLAVVLAAPGGATDTADKRSSAVNLSCPWRGLLPLPGAMTAADRAHVAFMYRGLIEEPSPPTQFLQPASMLIGL